ncbi:STM3941 family protein [Shouchella clausii]|uniref:Uncharacterized protein n=1 Tax=Shouchella clausii TaxID=79880 RepID=A0A268NYH4_SHOCL|nr:STM3941 family protein [Shouchella clausii]MDO7269118.1 STM3941 family protein [Shouchella clausii]MDO7288665.1 STM3941 family protein [Shouchella clausii]PAE88552.1 hypothetical protein CHH72_12995 [Shouchella clausii]
MSKKVIVEENQVIIYPNPVKLALLCTLAFLLTALTAVLAMNQESLVQGSAGIFETLFPIVAPVAIVFFGLCFIYLLYRVLKPKPSLHINQEGIIDNASAAGAGLIRWEEVDRYFIYSVLGQHFLGIVPKDIDRVLAKQKGFKQMAMRMNQGFEAPINIPAQGISVPLDQVIIYMEQFMEKQKASV